MSLCQPCPLADSRGASTATRLRSSGSLLGAVAAHLVRKIADSNGLLKPPREACRFEPIASLERQSCQCEHGNALRARVVLELPSGLRPIDVRKPDVHQDHVRNVLGREGDPLGASRRFERLEPGGAQKVPGELPILLVVVDDQDERHRRILISCRSASCSRRTTTSSAKASGGCSRPGRTSRSRPRAATSTRCSPQSTQSGRTWSSRTSAFLLAARTRGSRPRCGCATRIQTSAWSCSASTRTRRTCSRCSREGALF